MASISGKKICKKNNSLVTSTNHSPSSTSSISSFSVEILKEISTTPTPNYSTMEDADIKVSFIM